MLAFGAAFIALKIAGAGYLIYLGVRRWRNAGTSRAARDVPPRTGFARAVAIGTGFGLGNTQAILFYVALVPQVLHGQPATFVEFGLLCLATLATVFGAVASAYVLLATRVRTRLADRRGSKGVDRTAAVLMAATGVVVVAR